MNAYGCYTYTIHADTGSQGCAQGFISMDTLKLVEQKTNFKFIASSGHTIYVVPDLKFSEGGLLERWIFVAHKTLFNNNDCPHFQVWRRTGSTLTAVKGTATFSLPPVPVEAGDLVGWSQANIATANLRLTVIKNTGYNIHQVTSGDENTIQTTMELDFQSIPLIGTKLLGE